MIEKSQVKQDSCKNKQIQKLYNFFKTHFIFITRSVILLVMLVVLIIALILAIHDYDVSLLMTISIGLIYLFIVGIMVYFIIYPDSRHFKLILPRILGAIIVGYIPLVMQGDAWKLAYRMFFDKLILGIFVFLVLAASFMYLILEIKKNTDKSLSSILYRTTNVFLTGLIEAIGIGLILCSLISKFFSPERLELCLPIYPIELPIVEGMYPQVLLLFVPLALFIGIFVQILWEDKPVSEPI